MKIFSQTLILFILFTSIWIFRISTGNSVEYNLQDENHLEQVIEEKEDYSEVPQLPKNILPGIDLPKNKLPSLEEQTKITENRHDYLDVLPIETTSQQKEDVDNKLGLYIKDRELRTILVQENIVDQKEIGNRSNFKTWTDYRALGKKTPNYKLCSAAQVDDNGLLVYNGYYLVAMGTGWGIELGSTFIIITDTLNIFPVMICDEKSDKHTNDSHKYHIKDGSVVEFYVDKQKLCREGRYHGNIGRLPNFSGNIIAVIPLSGEGIR